MTQNNDNVLSAQDCLVALMVAVSASDENIRTAELVKIQSAVNMLPIFADYDIDRMNTVSQIVFDLFEQEDGLDALFGLIRDSLPERLNETGYALACDVAAADGAGQAPFRPCEHLHGLLRGAAALGRNDGGERDRFPGGRPAGEFFEDRHG